MAVLTTALPRRCLAPLVSALAATALVLSLIALAAPAAHAQDDDTDDEGGSQSLREALDEAATRYQDAQAELEEFQTQELSLVRRLEELADEREDLIAEIQIVAAEAYRTGRVGAVTALINSNSPAAFLERAMAVDMIATRDAQALNRLREITGEVEDTQAELAEVIASQEEEVAELEAAQEQAEEALFAIGGGQSGEFEAYPSEPAEPAPRNSDGSFPAESCSETDPTTSGCISPRMLHAYNEAQLFGFNRYTSCWRSGTFGEHPVGRACDLAAFTDGFRAQDAFGSDKTYGDRLASFFVFNADALGVQYVIWYRQIWFPGLGWRAYSGAGGDAASAHTNHVHLSVR